jgi:hypothetical protein
MSTLNTTNITNGTDSITVEGAVKGSAKAWVKFNSNTTVFIYESYNISSITDLGVGEFSVNFTTAMPSADYCSVLGVGTIPRVAASTNSLSTASSADFRTTTPDGIAVDMAANYIAIFR